MLTELDFTAFEEKKEEKAFVVIFYSQTCAHCKRTEPGLEELSETYKGQAEFGKCDIEKVPNLVRMLDVRSLPTVLFFRNGQEVNRKIGFTHKLIAEEEVKKLLK